MRLIEYMPVDDPSITAYTMDDSDVRDVSLTAWEDGDGASDTPAWGERVMHVHIRTDSATVATGLVVHLNDGPPIYQGDPEQHSAAADVLREVRQALQDRGLSDLGKKRVALNIIKRSGVIL